MSRFLRRLILPSCLLAAACVSEGPKIEPTKKAIAGSPELATLDLRGARGLQVYKDGTELGEKHLLKPGRHILHFSLDAIHAKDLKYPCDYKFKPSDLLDIRFYAIAPLLSPCFAVRAASRVSSRSRTCYAVTFNAERGRVYLPRLDRRAPRLTYAAGSRTISESRVLHCKAVDDARKAAERERVSKLIVLARNDPRAQYQLYEEAPIGSVDEFKWLCRSASHGYPKAIAKLISWYAIGGHTVRKNIVTAFAWTLVLKRKDSRAGTIKEAELKPEMTPAQIAKARRRAARWRPNPKRCFADYVKPAHVEK